MELIILVAVLAFVGYYFLVYKKKPLDTNFNAPYKLESPSVEPVKETAEVKVEEPAKVEVATPAAKPKKAAAKPKVAAKAKPAAKTAAKTSKAPKIQRAK